MSCIRPVNLHLLLGTNVWFAVLSRLHAWDQLQLEQALHSSCQLPASWNAWSWRLTAAQRQQLRRTSVGTFDWRRAALRRTYVEDLFSCSDKSVQFRSFLSHQTDRSRFLHLPRGSENLLITSTHSNGPSVHRIDVDNSRYCYIQRLHAEPVNLDSNLDSTNSMLAITGDESLNIWKRSNDAYVQQSVYPTPHQHHRNPRIIERNTVLLFAPGYGMRLVDLRMNQNSLSGLFIESPHIFEQLYLVQAPSDTGDAERKRAKATTPHEATKDAATAVNLEHRNSHDASSQWKRDGLIISVSMCDILLWDMRHTRYAVERLCLDRGFISGSAFVADGEAALWVVENWSRLHLFDISQRPWSADDLKTIELSSLGIESVNQQEATADYVLVSDDNGNIHTFYSDLPLSPVNADRRKMPVIEDAVTLCHPVRDHMVAIGHRDGSVEVFTIADPEFRGFLYGD